MLPIIPISAGLLPAACKSKVPVEHKEEILKTICYICKRSCGMDVYVKDGKIEKIEGALDNPVSKGYLCAKGMAAKELVYAPDRLKYPMKKEGDSWKRISWDDALTTIAKKLHDGKQKYGPESLVIHTGKGSYFKGELRTHVNKFCSIYGTPNTSYTSSLCSAAAGMAATLTYGGRASADIKNTNCVIVWGSNPMASSPVPVASDILEAKERGVKVIVIDPRVTATAQHADLHLRVRPGTDCALALAFMNVIINEKLYDEKFVQEWTIGFDELSKVVKDYSPEKVEELTWVPSGLIKEAARLYGKTRPACIAKRNALLVQVNGIQTTRAICILQAITGNLDVKGGGIISSGSGDNSKKKLPVKPIGAVEYPVWYEMESHAQANLVPDAILNNDPYPIKNMIIIGGNPVLTFPNTKKWKKALNSLEFVVAMDYFMTETAKFADIVLPASTFFEIDEIGAPQVIPALWESIPAWKFVYELARKMEMEKFFWEEESEKKKFKRYEKKGFKTPSGKVEIYSGTLKEYGYDPVPVHHEPVESPISSPELVKEYPLILLAGIQLPMYMHSQLRNLPSLRSIMPHPVVEINDVTARDLSIADGEEVIAETKRGSIKLRAKITKDILPGVVAISHGWKEANVNILTNNKGLDPISGFPSFNGLLCRVKKL
jgi:anaerobic selenocysteine-containing dehydrogenase